MKRSLAILCVVLLPHLAWSADIALTENTHSCSLQYRSTLYGNLDLSATRKTRTELIDQLANDCLDGLKRNNALKNVDDGDLVVECANRIVEGCPPTI